MNRTEQRLIQQFEQLASIEPPMETLDAIRERAAKTKRSTSQDRRAVSRIALWSTLVASIVLGTVGPVVTRKSIVSNPAAAGAADPGSSNWYLYGILGGLVCIFLGFCLASQTFRRSLRYGNSRPKRRFYHNRIPEHERGDWTDRELLEMGPPPFVVALFFLAGSLFLAAYLLVGFLNGNLLDEPVDGFSTDDATSANAAYLACVNDLGYSDEFDEDLESVRIGVWDQKPAEIVSEVDIPAEYHVPCWREIGGTVQDGYSSRRADICDRNALDEELLKQICRPRPSE